MCQSEPSVVQSEYHLHNFRFVSAAGRLAGGQRLDERPGTGGIAPNQVIARSDFEVHREMFTE